MYINVGKLNKFSFIYLIIHILIFILGWLNPIFLTISLLSLTYLLIKVMLDKVKGDQSFFIQKRHIFIISIICILVSISIGFNGTFWQADPDMHVRNALIRDLVNFSWPVIYNNDVALNYYFGFFLPPALIGKLFLLLNFKAHTATEVAQVMTTIWVFIGMLLTSMQVVVLTNAKKSKSVLAILIFLLFSGLDIFLYNFSYPKHLHFDLHFPFCYAQQYLTIKYACHIIIPIWLSTMLFLHKKSNISWYGPITMLVMFFCPPALFGLSLYLYIISIKFFVKNDIKSILKNIFSLQNILSIFIICPIIILFYKSNYASSQGLFYLHKINFTFLKICFFEAFIYIFLIAIEFKKDRLFYVTAISLFIFPLIAFITPFDFGMRVISLPITLLSLYVIRFLFIENSYKMLKYMLSFALILGSITPILSLIKEIDCMIKFPERIIKDEIRSFKKSKDIDEGMYSYKNYVTIGLKKHIFWEYIAKTNRRE